MNNYDDMKVAALPLDIRSGEPETNRRMAQIMIEALPKGIDILVLPELFTTGFVPDAAKCAAMAETNDGPTMQMVRSLAASHGMAIAGTFLACTGDRLFNRAFFVEPGGDAMFYDKRHLFMLSDEPKIMTPGSVLPPTYRYRGWNVSIIVCYDLRFPAWCRNVGLRYDLLLVPANWPKRRRHAWKSLLEARAIENQAYVVGANRGGSDFENETYMIDYMGKIMSVDQATTVFATFKKSALDKFRQEFPVWESADQFTLQ